MKFYVRSKQLGLTPSIPEIYVDLDNAMQQDKVLKGLVAGRKIKEDYDWNKGKLKFTFIMTDDVGDFDCQLRLASPVQYVLMTNHVEEYMIRLGAIKAIVDNQEPKKFQQVTEEEWKKRTE